MAISYNQLGSNGRLGNQMFQYAGLRGIASNLNYDWLKSHDEKINKLEENMIGAYEQIHKLHVELGTHK